MPQIRPPMPTRGATPPIRKPTREELQREAERRQLESYDRMVGAHPPGQYPQLDMPAASPEPITDPSQMPAGTFQELRRRFRQMPKGSPDRRFGIVDEEGPGGETYRFDRYRNWPAQGYEPRRDKGLAYNRVMRYLQSQNPQLQERNIASRQEDYERRMEERKMAREDALNEHLATARGAEFEENAFQHRMGAVDKALDRSHAEYMRTLPPAMHPAMEDYYDSAAEANRARAEYNRGGGRQAAGRREPIEKYPPEMRKIEGNKSRLQAEIQDLTEAQSDRRWWGGDDERGVELETVDEYGVSIKVVVPENQIGAAIAERKFKLEQADLQLAELRKAMGLPGTAPAGGVYDDEPTGGLDAQQDPQAGREPPPGPEPGYGKSAPGGGQATTPTADQVPAVTEPYPLYEELTQEDIASLGTQDRMFYGWLAKLEREGQDPGDPVVQQHAIRKVLEGAPPTNEASVFGHRVD